MSDHEFQTPSKPAEENEQVTTQKGDQPVLAQSKYEEVQKQQSSKNQPANQLDEIENEIKECGRRLQELKLQMLKQTDKYSDRSLDLEQERNNVRKRIMDLDFEHKILCANIIKENKEKQAEEKERAIREAQEQRQRRRQQLQQKLERSRMQRQEKMQKLRAENEESRERRQEQQPQQEQQQPKVEGKQEQEGSGLERSRRKARIAQIQAQLTESRLRRSRMASLNTQLDYLRASYLRPSYYYPYPSYPGYPYYRDYLYPSAYSPSYPYYGYRWWL